MDVIQEKSACMQIRWEGTRKEGLVLWEVLDRSAWCIDEIS